MVIRIQEARDALETYIKAFYITNFPGKNVPTACLCFKAVAGALGDKDLPTNAIRKALEGFAKSSTKSFNNFCASQIALRRRTFYRTLMKNTSLQNQLPYRSDGARKVPPKVVFLILEYYFLFVVCTIPT